MDPKVLQLTTAEKQQLWQDLSNFCEPHGFFFDAKGICHTKAKFDIKSQALKKVVGKPMTDCLPTGEGRVKLNAILVEIQMFLKDHSINQARRELKQPTVDAIWLSPASWWS